VTVAESAILQAIVDGQACDITLAAARPRLPIECGMLAGVTRADLGDRVVAFACSESPIVCFPILLADPATVL
jgi:hypothetical protein